MSNDQPSIYNAKTLKKRRQALRRNNTEAEKKLWQYLRNSRCHGFKFFRQYSVGNYILDFYCPLKRLAIELDGGHHAESNQVQHDEKREKFLNFQGIQVLRFWNNEVLKNLEGVFLKISESLNESQEGNKTHERTHQ